MNIALVGINFSKECSPYIEDLFSLLSADKHDIFIAKPFYDFLISSEGTLNLKHINASTFIRSYLRVLYTNYSASAWFACYLEF